jgi:hypothetical protein
MKKDTPLFAVLVMAAIVAAVPAASAQKVHFLSAGASAMYQGVGVAAYNDLALGILSSTQCTGTGITCKAFHWTLASNAADAVANDTRAAIPGEPGNVWVVWVTCTTAGPATCPTYTDAAGTSDIWAQISLDSVVSVRELLGRNSAGQAATLELPTSLASTTGANKISHSLFSDNSSDQAGLPADVQAALNGTQFTAALTDIRPEDALQATLRVLGNCPSSGCNTDNVQPAQANGCPNADVEVPTTYPPCSDPTYVQSYTLGYGPAVWSLPGPYPNSNQVGTQIQDSFAGPTATPVGFSLPGFNDPFSGSAVPTTIQVFPIGESPVILITNRTNAQGLGAIIGNIPACAANGAGTDAVICVDDPANGGPTYNGGTGLGYASDGSYLVRNVWDQHPFPAVDQRYPDLNYTPLKTGDGYCGNPTYSATGPCKESRRPLGSLFAGYLLETASYAFTWPLDSALQGNRGYFPTNGSGSPFNAPVVTNSVPVTVIEREALSGTYNAFEYTEVRRFGGTQGNFDYNNASGRWIYTAYLSQDTFVDGTAANAAGDGTHGPYNPLSLTGQTAFQDPGTEGLRPRAVGTSSMVANVKATTDSIGYTFFSFGNVSTIATSKSYGYLMIDGIDPIFNNYSASGALDPGQPAVNAQPTTWGELPTCTGASCKASAIWNTTAACAGGAANALGCSYPHLRDGTYPAWSELRLVCDTALASCSTDPYGAEALVQNLQHDIHTNALGGVPDLLPFSDSAGAGSVCTGCSFNPPFGDVSYIRDHSANLASGTTLNCTPAGDCGPATSYAYGTFILADDYQDRVHNVGPFLSTLGPQTIHKTIGQQTTTQLETVCGGGAGVNSPPKSECGGDVGGWVIPTTASAAAQGQQQ